MVGYNVKGQYIGKTLPEQESTVPQDTVPENLPWRQQAAHSADSRHLAAGSHPLISVGTK